MPVRKSHDGFNLQRVSNLGYPLQRESTTFKFWYNDASPLPRKMVVAGSALSGTPTVSIIYSLIEYSSGLICTRSTLTNIDLLCLRHPTSPSTSSRLGSAYPSSSELVRLSHSVERVCDQITSIITNPRRHQTPH